jgi:putative transposase
MSRNYYSEINLHIVWHTKGSLPLLNARVEPVAHQYLRGKIINWPGAYVHEIGGTENHVHLAVSMAPSVLISEFIGQLKGASSHEVNQKCGGSRKVLEWESGYGVVSFGTKDLPWVVEYIRKQKVHHRTGHVIDWLERITAEEAAEAKPREAPRTELRGFDARLTRRQRRA